MAGRLITSLFLAGLVSLGAVAQAQTPETDDDGAVDDARAEASEARSDAGSADARIAAARSELKLTPEQEKHWPAVEAALRDVYKQRSDEAEARRNRPRPGQDPIGAIRAMADISTARGEALRRFAEAASPLAASLEQRQKRQVFAMIRPARGDRDGKRGDGGGRGPRGERDGRE